MRVVPAVSALLGVLFTPSLWAVNKTELPAILAKPETVQSFKVSPDGRYLSARFRIDNDWALAFFDASNMKMLNAVRLAPGNHVGEYHWVNSERVVMKLMQSEVWDRNPKYYGELMGVNIDGSKRELLFGYRAGEQQIGSLIKKREGMRAWAEFIEPKADAEGDILISATPMSDSEARIPKLLAMNVYTGKVKNRGTVPATNATVLAGANGRGKVAVGMNAKFEKEVYLRDNPESTEWHKLADARFGNYFVPLAMSADDKKIIVLDNLQDKAGIHEFDLATKKYTELYTDEKVDVDNVLFSTDGRTVYGMRVDDGRPSYMLLPDAGAEGALFKELLGVFPGAEVQITSQTQDGKKQVIYTASDINPGTYYLFDADKGKLQKLADVNADVMQLPMAEMEPISFKARDGYTLHGYLTKAPSVSAQKPLVVLVHGGPIARDYWGFDNEVQLLALSGYNVLQVNYRGSSGYGMAHQHAGALQWGGLIQQDIIDGTLWAMEQGYGRKGNTCIVGASFGGYSAMMAPSLAKDLYSCAVGTVGVYDLNLMFAEGDVQQKHYGKAYLTQQLGTDAKQRAAFSPVNHVADLPDAVLLMHGKKDERAPIEHAHALKAAMDKAGKKYQWVEFDDEGHGFYDESNQRLYLQNLQQFLGAHLKI